jgi:hypothetical protein
VPRGSVTVEVELRYQPIAYRWAQNLTAYRTAETARFERMYNGMAEGSSTVLAPDTTDVR